MSQMKDVKDLVYLTDAEWEAVFLAACDILARGREATLKVQKLEDPDVDKWAALDHALEKSAELAR